MSMNILLSRILTYLNGTLFIDYRYKFCQFVVYHYLEFEDYTFDDVIEKSGLTEEEILSFIALLGFSTFEDFAKTLVRDHYVRLDQIRARMLDVNSDAIIAGMEKSGSDDEMREYVSTICEAIDKANRIVIIGALYPLCLSVEFQTDLITFGKTIIQYHSFDKSIALTDKDVVIFISATGRSMNSFIKIKQEVGVDKATSILITQNKTYLQPEYRISDYVLQVPGKFDGLNFNHQILTIFDLLRVHYYQQYYLG